MNDSTKRQFQEADAAADKAIAAFIGKIESSQGNGTPSRQRTSLSACC